MSELPLQTKTEINLDLTKTVENVYNDTLKEPLTSSSKAISTVLDFFHNTVMYPMQKYNLYAEGKLQKFAKKIENEVKGIPDENLVYPRVNILGPTIEGLKYNLDEDYIRDYFTNILVADMDDRLQNKVLPSYIEIVKQLSRDDAEMLQFFKEKDINDEPIIKIKYIYDNGGFHYVSNNIGLLYNGEDIILKAVILDNLSRLRLIELHFDEYRKDKTLYDNTFEKIKLRDEFKILPNSVSELGYTKGLIKVTEFGKNFIDICLS